MTEKTDSNRTKVVREVVDRMVQSGELPDEEREFAVRRLERALRASVNRRMLRLVRLVDAAATAGSAF
jgi:hypothetical protein